VGRAPVVLTAFHLAQLVLLGAAAVVFVRAVRALSRCASGASGPSAHGIDEAHAEVAHLGSSGAYALRGIGRVAPALGLVGAIVAMGKGFGAPSGLAALKAGYAEQVALVQAGVAMGIGVATAFACLAAARVVARRAQVTRKGLDRAARALDRPAADV
jgi:biopolymer transport protein ExbB/TolQ